MSQQSYAIDNNILYAKRKHSQLTGFAHEYDLEHFKEDISLAARARIDLLNKIEGMNFPTHFHDSHGNRIKDESKHFHVLHVNRYHAQWIGSAKKRLKIYHFLMMCKDLEQTSFKFSHRVYHHLFCLFTGRNGISRQTISEYLDAKEKGPDSDRISDPELHAMIIAKNKIFIDHKDLLNKELIKANKIVKGTFSGV